MTLSVLVVIVAQILLLAILVRAVLSWFPPSRSLAPVVGVLATVTDPVLDPIRRRLPALGGFDLSPLVALLLIQVAEGVLLSILGGH